MSCSTFHTRYTRNLIMSYIQGKSLDGLMRCSVRARAFVLRLWETERLQGEASTNAHVRTRTDSQKKKRREMGVGGGGRRAGGAEAHRSEYKSARPKGIFASRAIRCASFQAIWSEQQDPGKQY